MSDRESKVLYRNCEFSNELEARWAVFFDYLDIPWQYERECFDLGAGLSYLPTFWLPDHDLFFVVTESAPTDLDQLKAYFLSTKIKRAVVVASGMMKADADDNDDFSVRLFAGEAWDAWEPIGRGDSMRDSDIIEFMPKFIMGHFPDLKLPEEDSAEKRRIMVELDKAYYRNKHGKEHNGYNWGRNQEVHIGCCVDLGIRFFNNVEVFLEPVEAYEEALSKTFNY